MCIAPNLDESACAQHGLINILACGRAASKLARDIPMDAAASDSLSPEDIEGGFARIYEAVAHSPAELAALQCNIRGEMSFMQLLMEGGDMFDTNHPALQPGYVMPAAPPSARPMAALGRFAGQAFDMAALVQHGAQLQSAAQPHMAPQPVLANVQLPPR